MLKFTFKFIKSLSVFTWRVFLIFFGLIFHSLGRAATDFGGFAECVEEPQNKVKEKTIIWDEFSAERAFHNGEINQAQLQEYYELKGEYK